MGLINICVDSKLPAVPDRLQRNFCLLMKFFYNYNTRKYNKAHYREVGTTFDFCTLDKVTFYILFGLTSYPKVQYEIVGCIGYYFMCRVVRY